jgi:hypothetical protein
VLKLKSSLLEIIAAACLAVLSNFPRTISLWVSTQSYLVIKDSRLEDSAKGEKSPETAKLRASIREGCEQMVIDFFQKEGGQVAIYDANNGTKRSRKAVGERFEAMGVHVIFLGWCGIVSYY